MNHPDLSLYFTITDPEMLEIICALEELQIPVTIVESVSAVIEFVKGFLLRRGFQISPLTEELLDTLDALVRAHVRKIMLANDPLVKSVMEAKKKTQSRLRQLDHMLTYDKHSKITFSQFTRALNCGHVGRGHLLLGDNPA